jgi:pimeloyl-ACP methyl ester carboxylesterase
MRRAVVVGTGLHAPGEPVPNSEFNERYGMDVDAFLRQNRNIRRLAKAPDFDQFAYAVVRSVGAMLDEPTTPHLGRIRQPTLIVYGRFDHLIPNPYLHPGRARDVFRAGAEAIPDARLVEIDGAGHMVIIEAADQVNRAILEFVGG